MAETGRYFSIMWDGFLQGPASGAVACKNGMDSSPVGNRINLLEEFIASRQGSRGLTPKGETWLRETLTKFLQWLPVPLAEADTATIIRFLSQYDDKPWRKHSLYRALRAFWKWASRTYDTYQPLP